jgi:hypothetical protein
MESALSRSPDKKENSVPQETYLLLYYRTDIERENSPNNTLLIHPRRKLITPKNFTHHSLTDLCTYTLPKRDASQILTLPIQLIYSTTTMCVASNKQYSGCFQDPKHVVRRVKHNISLSGGVCNCNWGIPVLENPLKPVIGPCPDCAEEGKRKHAANPNGDGKRRSKCIIQ